MNPEDSADPFGGGASGTGRTARRGPAIGSDGAVAPAGGTVLGAGPPGPAAGTALPDVSGSSWAWDPVPPAAAAVPEQRDGSAALPEDEDGAAVGSSSVVRPYVRTGGRTRSSLDLSLETLVSVLPKEVPLQLGHDEAAVLGICRDQSRSVAEVAA